MTRSIGRLEPVALRDMWAHEERGFSAWLERNLDTLGETLGMRFSDPRREVAVGSFTVDIVAEEETAGLVVIENQLEPTDHDHLGKVLTYLTNLEAKAAIWIARTPRPEHVRAVSWLNETSPEDVAFFLVQLAAYRIGDSEPAPLFTVVAGPTPEGRGFGQQKKVLAERHLLRLKFWEQLLARAREKGVHTHAGRSRSKDSWIGAGAGRTGLSFVYNIWKDDESGVELYIDTGDEVANKAIFDGLHAMKVEIERSFGGPLSWERLDEKRGCRIRHVIKQGGLSSGEENWPPIQEAMIDAMARLAPALTPHLRTAGAS